jgi:hypothetical protein
MAAALASPVALLPVYPCFPESSRLLGRGPRWPRSHAPPDACACLDASPHGESCGIAGVGRRGAQAAAGPTAKLTVERHLYVPGHWHYAAAWRGP